MNNQQSPATWRVKQVLEANNLSPYRLAQELSGVVSRNSVYAIAAGTAKRADLGTIGAMVEALRSLTGNRELAVGDLLDYSPTHGDAEETAAVLADHPEIADRVRRLEAGESRLIPWHEVKSKLSL